MIVDTKMNPQIPTARNAMSHKTDRACTMIVGALSALTSGMWTCWGWEKADANDTSAPPMIMVSAIITMTLHTAAYIAEIIRGAIQNVPHGEVEAARALGMSRSQALLHIILPRATRIGLPAYSNEVILMLKASALASTITLLELTGMARKIAARTYLHEEMFLTAGLIYLLIAFVLMQGFKLLERWLRVDACQGR